MDLMLINGRGYRPRQKINGRGSTGPHKMATVQKRIRYSEGDVYEGQWSSEGKREGKGKLQMSTGDHYSGEFMNGFFHGLGVLVHSDGGKYEGSFELGRYHGHGIYTHSDRTKYEVKLYIDKTLKIKKIKLKILDYYKILH